MTRLFEQLGVSDSARMLSEVYDLVHVSVGDIFRWNVQVLAIFERKEFVVNVDAGRTEDEIFEEIRHRLCLPPVVT